MNSEEDIDKNFNFSSYSYIFTKIMTKLQLLKEKFKPRKWVDNIEESGQYESDQFLKHKNESFFNLWLVVFRLMLQE